MINMVEYVSRNIVTEERAVNDDGHMQIDLGNKGGISALFLRLTATNGAGGSASYGLRSQITEIRVKTGKGTYPFRLSASDLYALNTLRDGIAEELSEDTGAGAVQAVRLPIYFSLNRDDAGYGLDLEENLGATLEIEYALTVSGADGFVSQSLAADVDALITKGLVRPIYRGRMNTVVLRSHRTGVQDPHINYIKSPMRPAALYAYAYKSGTADNALVSNIKLMRAGDNDPLVDSSFSDLQYRYRKKDGSIITSYAQIWKAPGRDGREALRAENDSGLELHLRELVADGEVRIIMEWIGGI
jgi:hypothetical protein